MSAAPDYITLYEFERLISATLVALFNAEEITAYGVGTDPEFQKERPRVEVFLTIGGRFDNHYVLDNDGQRRENGWTGTLTLSALTPANPTLHSRYLAAIRNQAAKLDQLDLTSAETVSVPLEYHEITEVKTGGTAPTIEPEKGYFQTALSFDFVFGILPGAWPAAAPVAD